MREPTVCDGSAVAENHGGSVVCHATGTDGPGGYTADREAGALGQLFRVRPDGGNAGTIAGGPRHEYWYRKKCVWLMGRDAPAGTLHRAQQVVDALPRR
jgi:hypothetical protein